MDQYPEEIETAEPALDPPPDDVAIDDPPPMDKRPCYRNHPDWWKSGKSKMKPGLYYHGTEEKEGEPVAVDTWISTPLEMKAATADRAGANHGRLIEFQDAHGQPKRWNMPMRLLSASGDELRAELLDLGAMINPRKRQLLVDYLFSTVPRERLESATRIGWHGESFVLPTQVFGDQRIVYLSEQAHHREFESRGDLAEWRQEVASLAVGNGLLILAISASFAGPLMALCHVDHAGLHFHGPSSTGKTTALQAAGATWGGRGFVRTWRATGNGLEAAAAASNDTILVLDEIGEAPGKEIAQVVYALGNGRGKSRANVKGNARAVAEWRVVLISSGERSLADYMREAGQGAKAGHGVRLLNVPVDRPHGLFDHLHQFADSRALADHLKTATGASYGTAGPEFLQRLVGEHGNRDFAGMLNILLERFKPDGGQEARAARQFALLGLAGELATEYDITGWPEGAAMNAALAGFESWRNGRGRGDAETRQILEVVRDFTDRHGDSRFSDIHAAETTTTPMIRERAGWTDGELYLFTKAGLEDATDGHDFRRALHVLESAGWFEPGTDRPAILKKVQGQPRRLYRVRVGEVAE